MFSFLQRILSFLPCNYCNKAVEVERWTAGLRELIAFLIYKQLYPVKKKPKQTVIKNMTLMLQVLFDTTKFMVSDN